MHKKLSITKMQSSQELTFALCANKTFHTFDSIKQFLINIVLPNFEGLIAIKLLYNLKGRCIFLRVVENLYDPFNSRWAWPI